MFKKIDKVLAAFGNMRAMERLHVDTVTENKIESAEGDKIAESREGAIFCGTSEINDYLFLETTIISGVKIKTFGGASLVFSQNGSEFTLKSDTQEIDPDFSNVSDRFIARVSFDITKEEVNKIRNGEFEKVQFCWKKKSLTFDKVI